ncbi:MAG TPA: hypothetical protein VGM63_24525, partial [Mucilaginibacter sp.]
MRKLYLAILGSLIFVFGAKAQTSIVKEYYNFKIDTTIEVSILYQNNFYCLKSDNQIFVVDAETHLIDSSYQDNSKNIKLLNLYLLKDTLIGLTRWNTYFLNGQHKWILRNKGISIPPIYEDDNYLVSSTCSGEFGGSLYFQDKKTKELHECACTCDVNLIKDNEKYIVTASLSHLAGYTNVFQIADPSKLKLYIRDYLIKK